MKRKISGEEIFSCASGAIAVAQTSGGYILEYSTDGINFTQLKKGDEVVEVPANEDLFIANAIVGTYFRLKNNTDENVLVLC